MRYQLQDARTNMAISRNCKANIKQYCSDVKPGGGRTRRCLQKHFKKLTKPCQDAEFKTEKYFELAGAATGIKTENARLPMVSRNKAESVSPEADGESIGSKDITNSPSSVIVLKGPLAMMALSALCLSIVFGIYHFYKKFERQSKTYTVVVDKGG